MKRNVPTSRRKRTGRIQVKDSSALTLVAEGRQAPAVALHRAGSKLFHQKRYAEVVQTVEPKLASFPEDYALVGLVGRAHYELGNVEDAIGCLEKATELKSGLAPTHNLLANLYLSKSDTRRAERHARLACESDPETPSYYLTLGNVLYQQLELDAAKEAYQRCGAVEDRAPLVLNNLGNVSKDLGDLDEAIDYYQKGIDCTDGASARLAFSNKIIALHYHPEARLDDIVEACRQWNARFAPQETIQRAESADKSATRVIRLGMFSDGFRRHPVGAMIQPAAKHLPKTQFEIYLYSSSNVDDEVTKVLKEGATVWRTINQLNDYQFAQLIRDDAIDILVDLTGHNAGNRMMTVAQAPAPVIVKWVGGLINTTGVEAIDYLIGDHVECPEGIDSKYVEKIIRMPDDYICYTPPRSVPRPSSLPASANGYITLGCFNNPNKLNGKLISEWAGLMRSLENSRLYLRGKQFKSDVLVSKIKGRLAEYGIDDSRVLIEGPAGHNALLGSYNKVDIALDTWPYSGGLTTCEAFMMGVPVVSLPGPTFAGRHSATHLVNAGMPELVVKDWDEYKARVIELASDLDSLATIRRHLREVLLESPVCDGQRFARHFAKAMRAIWERYCAGKPPAALTFDQQGDAWFEDEAEPVNVVVDALENATDQGFRWELPEKIVVLDNSSKLLRSKGLQVLLKSKAFGIAAFDPASLVEKPERFQGSDRVQLFQHALLGDGTQQRLFVCVGPEMTGTLKPKAADALHEDQRSGAQVITELPISSVALDQIDGLQALDWLILDDRHDAVTILEHGQRALRNSLLIEVKIAFQPTHERQASLDEVCHWASRHGFRFYRLDRPTHRSHLPKRENLRSRSFSELVAANALFVPSHERMRLLSDRQRIKLAFILHSVYEVQDLAYRLLAGVDAEAAEAYLVQAGIIAAPQADGDEAEIDIGGGLPSLSPAPDPVDLVATDIQEGHEDSVSPNAGGVEETSSDRDSAEGADKPSDETEFVFD